MLATKLSSALVSPSKVACILDWRRAVGAVMSLNITRDRIGVAVAEHPEHFAKSDPLDALSLQDQILGETKKLRGISKESLTDLEEAVKQHRVCAFVVNWPVNEGRMGEQCGRVLRVLDSVIAQSNCVVTNKRPFALWNDVASEPNDVHNIDKWGRSVIFSHAPEPEQDMRYSSKDTVRGTSSSDPSLVAASVLDSWIKNNWEIDNKLFKASAPKKTRSDYFFSTNSVDEYTNEKACLQTALL